jgi:tetratricopeptide (TPR) repeat protein
MLRSDVRKIFLIVLFFGLQGFLSNKNLKSDFNSNEYFFSTVNQHFSVKHVPSILRAAADLSGFRTIMADFFWIETVEYYGDFKNQKLLYPDLYQDCRVIASLNPYFEINYTFGGAALAFELGRSGQAINLLKIGSYYNPKDVVLKYMMAAIVYQHLHQLNKVVAFLKYDIDSGKAPQRLINILANTYIKLKKYSQAKHLWEVILHKTHSVTEREEAVRKLAAIYKLLNEKKYNRRAGIE